MGDWFELFDFINMVMYIVLGFTILITILVFYSMTLEEILEEM